MVCRDPRFVAILALLAISFSNTSLAQTQTTKSLAVDNIGELGRQLFFDPNLSRNGNQSCASCHNPKHAFIDNHDNSVAGAVSIGDNGHSLGERNAATITYAQFTPEFHIDTNGNHVGGFFRDGRETSLSDQAGRPILDPIEMGMLSKASVVERILENPVYVASFKKLFQPSIFSSVEQTYKAIEHSLSTFERIKEIFAPFDSKYDRYLAGEYKMTKEEELGRKLFFSGLHNCNTCHQLDQFNVGFSETFSNYRFYNIGIPPSTTVNSNSDLPVKQRDQGLLANPDVNDPALLGKFKVPTLRNIAVTGPYMHNGVFNELRTVLVFYNKYIIRNKESQTNPETGELWADPEIKDTIDLDLLKQGQPLFGSNLDAMLAFLLTLTDKRYEVLLKEKKVSDS